MARFYLTARNGHGNEQSIGGIGGRASVEEVHIRGWRAGVKISTNSHQKDSDDELSVYMTSGSNGGADDVLLGMVHATPNGPVFVPAGETLGRAEEELTQLRQQAAEVVALSDITDALDDSIADLDRLLPADMVEAARKDVHGDIS